MDIGDISKDIIEDIKNMTDEEMTKEMVSEGCIFTGKKGENMDNKIKEAISLLHNNGYKVIKFTKRMKLDEADCTKQEEQGDSKDCSECSCSICVGCEL